MRRSVVSFALAAALLLQCYTLPAASPLGKSEDASLETDTFISMLSEEGADNGLADLEPAPGSKSREPRVIVVADPSLWRELRGLRVGNSLFKRRADDNGSAADHREAPDANVPILRRDTMRCMVGRVYRPCWEV